MRVFERESGREGGRREEGGREEGGGGGVGGGGVEGGRGLVRVVRREFGGSFRVGVRDGQGRRVYETHIGAYGRSSAVCSNKLNQNNILVK